MATGAMLVAALSVTAGLWASGEVETATYLELTPVAIAAVIYLGLVSTALATLIYFFLVPRLGATRMSLVNFAVPVGGTLIGAALLGEAVTLSRLAALAVICSAILLVNAQPRRAPA